MHAFAAALLDAMAQRRLVPRHAPVPQSREEAEAVQTQLIGALGGAGGWKVSPWSGDEKAMLAAPIPQAWVHGPGDIVGAASEILLEVELALILAEDRSFLLAPAFELVRSRLEPGTDWGAIVKSADLLATAGLVLGAAVPLPEDGSCEIRLSTSDDEQAVVTTTLAREPLLRAADWVMAQADRMGLPLSVGTPILTGARLGPIPVGPGRSVAEISGLGAVALRLA